MKKAFNRLLLPRGPFKGGPSNVFFGNIWDFVPTEGGGWGVANPKFLSNFSKTKFALELHINLMKHIIHRWGVDKFQKFQKLDLKAPLS